MRPARCAGTGLVGIAEGAGAGAAGGGRRGDSVGRAGAARRTRTGFVGIAEVAGAGAAGGGCRGDDVSRRGVELRDRIDGFNQGLEDGKKMEEIAPSLRS